MPTSAAAVQHLVFGGRLLPGAASKLAPVSTFTDGVSPGGLLQGPKDIRIRGAGGRGGSEALALADAGYIETEPDTAYVLEDVCCGCKTCIAMCPYHAATFSEERQKSDISQFTVQGCGTCVAACRRAAIGQTCSRTMKYRGNRGGCLTNAESSSRRSCSFCNWCTYLGPTWRERRG